MEFNLRDYQKECINLVDNLQQGSYLLVLATGLGKTVIFTNFKRKGKVLVLVHREELVTQAKSKFNCSVGIEMGKHSSNGEDVVIASVQTLINRLEKFPKDYFDMIIIDEAHHTGAKSYKDILNYFTNRLTIGVTATPNRSDNVRLDDVFQKIIYEKDIKWAIKNKYLCDIECIRVNLGYDISKVACRLGDYATNELDKQINTNAINKGVKEAYEKYAKGQTLIFATTVEHSKNIAELIPGAVAVTADTKNRAEIIDKFTKREIPVLVNCMIFTEGTDIPLVETVMIARPTRNSSLYTQMVGRGLRLYPGKEKLKLIDLVGTTGKANLCTAPSLIGIDISNIPEHKKQEIQGDLFDLPEIAQRESDCPESWIKNIQYVDLWAKEQEYNLHNINLFKMPNGDLVLNLKKKRFIIPCPDELCQVTYNFKEMKMQDAIDLVFNELLNNYADQKYIWDKNAIKSWGRSPASLKQKQMINRIFKGYDTSTLTKIEANQILNRLFYK